MVVLYSYRLLWAMVLGYLIIDAVLIEEVVAAGLVEVYEGVQTREEVKVLNTAAVRVLLSD
jgi:hypothetical protein